MSEITDFELELHTRKDGSDYLAIGNPNHGPHEQFNFNGSHEMAKEIVSRFNSHASLVEENARLREALNATTNMLEMTTGGQLCFNQIKHNRELVPAVKPSSAWPKSEALK